MSAKLDWLLPLALLAGCAGDPYVVRGEGTMFGRKDKAVWVKGPWPEIQPSTNVDDVIDQLCPSVMQLPRARDKDYGQEYCGGIYSLGDGMFYATWPSPLGRTTLVGSDIKRKHCIPPSIVLDARGRTVTLSDFHSHPWFPSPMSQEDRWAERQYWSIRIQFDSACTITKLVPHIGEPRPGEVYLRRGNKWKLIGLIHEEDKATGFITPVDEEN